MCGHLENVRCGKDSAGSQNDRALAQIKEKMVLRTCWQSSVDIPCTNENEGFFSDRSRFKRPESLAGPSLIWGRRRIGERQARQANLYG